MQRLTEVHVYSCCEMCKYLYCKKSAIDSVSESYYCKANLSPYNNGFGYACCNYQNRM